MINIEKCPVCGNPQVETLNEHAMPSGAYCCGVRCDSIEEWNKYATLEARHNALREAVKLMVQLETHLWTNTFENEQEYFVTKEKYFAARSEVDRLLEES